MRLLKKIGPWLCLGLLFGCAAKGPAIGGVTTGHEAGSAAVSETSDSQFGSSKNLDIYKEELRSNLLSEAEEGRSMAYDGRYAWENREDYSVIYEDKDYVSYMAQSYAYCGGTHGSTAIIVGTLERKSGRELTLDDVCRPEERAGILQKIRAAVIKELEERGEGCELQSEPTLTDNFCLKKDGWHFIFNQYEVTCYACGIVEVVIPGRPIK